MRLTRGIALIAFTALFVAALFTGFSLLGQNIQDNTSTEAEQGDSRGSTDPIQFEGGLPSLVLSADENITAHLEKMLAAGERYDMSSLRELNGQFQEMLAGYEGAAAGLAVPAEQEPAKAELLSSLDEYMEASEHGEKALSNLDKSELEAAKEHFDRAQTHMAMALGSI